MTLVCVAPMRVTPRFMTASRSSSVRTPPAALTCTCGEVTRRISARSSCVAPEGAKPVEVLTKSRAGGLDQARAALLLVVVEVGVLEDHLHQRPRVVRDCHHGGDVVANVLVATGAQRADLDHHVQLGGAVGERVARLEHLRRRRRRAVREADHRADGHVGPPKDRGSTPNVHGTDADRGHVVLRRQPAAGLDERVVQLRLQQGVVDRLRQLALGDGVHGEGLGHRLT